MRSSSKIGKTSLLLFTSFWHIWYQPTFLKVYSNDWNHWNDWNELIGQLNGQLARNETYFHECRAHFLYNNTWGKLRAPWADKLQVKQLIHDLGIPFLKIPRTLTHYDAHNISKLTLDSLKKLPDKFIIKPTYTTGQVSRVSSASYSCFKQCLNHVINATLPMSFETMFNMTNFSLHHANVWGEDAEAVFFAREPQYRYIPRRVLFEEHLSVDSLVEWQIWLADSHPMMVDMRCGHDVSHFSTRFNPLLIEFLRPPCRVLPTEKPKTFDRMLAIAKIIGKAAPPGVIRLDLYADDETIYFSEVTFTTARCKSGFQTGQVADALLYALSHKLISPERVTPEFVESVVNGDHYISETNES